MGRRAGPHLRCGRVKPQFCICVWCLKPFDGAEDHPAHTMNPRCYHSLCYVEFLKKTRPSLFGLPDQ